ncbi:hypothetical protein [Methylomagnum sp.]
MQINPYRRLPAPFPAPESMTVANASTWYRAMIPFIPDAIGSEADEFKSFVAAWGMKSRLRLAAALALYDQRLVARFFEAFPLPSVEEYIEKARANTGGDFGLDEILSLLLTFSEKEKYAFPGTVGGIKDPIGFEYSDGQSTYVFTEDGWKQKSYQAGP